MGREIENGNVVCVWSVDVCMSKCVYKYVQICVCFVSMSALLCVYVCAYSVVSSKVSYNSENT